MPNRLDDLILREIPYLRRFARVLASTDPAWADDLVHDCLERATAGQCPIKPKSSLRAWLFAILYDAFAESLRQNARRRIRIVDEAYSDQGARPQPQQHSAASSGIARAVALLPEDQRAALFLIAIEGFSYEEASEITKVPLDTVRSRLSLARASLRHHMEGREGATRPESKNDD
jgi:RNA polymerase sigma-70 factor (ECF subfamily)